MAQRQRRSKPLKRKSETRQERKTIIVFCEGEKSEPNYINALKKLPDIAMNTSINIELDPAQGVPLTLVRNAISRNSDPEVDECWCIFDVEWPQHHPNLKEAIQLARANDIKLAISNPCFELWLILHHQDYNRFVNTPNAERESRALDGRSGKSINASQYMPLRDKAVRRARLLDHKHQRDGSNFPENNPSSSMHEFLAAIEPPRD